MTERVRSLYVSTTQGYAGTLVKDAQHVFTYDITTVDPERPERAISLTMPPRAASWKTNPMLPVFQTFLPEGFLKEHIRARFGKTMRIDDMALLALSGANSIGRIRVSRDKPDGDPGAQRSAAESLKEILSDQGARDLFEYLCDKYLISTSIAGVQAKVVVPVAAAASAGAGKASIGERSTLRARQLIVKVDSGDYPDLSENEYHCLSIADACASTLKVPPFHLSDDRRRLAIERFDIAENGDYLGFEDMVALQGKVNDDKYDGSYENIAATIRDNCSPLLLADSLKRYFASVAFAVAVRNGDAHLKNFGLLYTSPSTDDCALSPVFDQVCTTFFIAKDTMALRLSKSKSWPGRATLEAFGRAHCELSRPGLVIDEILEAVASYRPQIDGPAWQKLKPILALSTAQLTKKRSYSGDPSRRA